jgi:hypothetical protein
LFAQYIRYRIQLGGYVMDLKGKISAEELFHKKTVGLGGRLLDARKLPLELQKHLSHHRERAEAQISDVAQSPRTRSTMPPVHFDYVDSSETNAVAFVEPGQDFIGVNYGAISKLYTTFATILDVPDCFPGLGGVSTGSNEKMRCLIVDAKFGDTRPETGFSVDNSVTDKLTYVCALASIAVDFLVAHELAHLRFGHVDYFRKKTGMGFYLEVGGRSGVSGLTLQTLEMDADAFGVKRSLGAVLMQGGYRFADKVLLGMSLEDSIWFWCVGVYTLFKIFDEVEPKYINLADLSHPPPRMRQIMNTDTMHRLVGRWLGPGHDEACERAVDECVMSVEKSWMTVTGTPPNIADVHAVTSEHAFEHVGNILSNWNAIFPALEPLSRGDDIVKPE